MRVFNTLTKRVEDFKPLSQGHVGMYHCGPTVYNFAHIGNLRSYVFADTLRRALELEGFQVKQVINITDVGHLTHDSDMGADKIEERAKSEHKSAKEIAVHYTCAFLDDLEHLNIDIRGTCMPRASDHIKEQVALIEKLEGKGVTYKTSDGIYFDTKKFPDYGKLGHIDTANLEEGARVAKNPEKKNPTDFALWKFSKAGEQRQQEWPSPWGVGFPGWHIECSAMSMAYLGETFDIHTGGIDHIPVHHNNEIAQSECATGKPYVKYWLHNAFVNVESGKMAKSEENFLRLQSLREQEIHSLAYRYWLLTAHYRSPVLFSFEAVHAAQNALEAIVRKIALAKHTSESGLTNFFKKMFGLGSLNPAEKEIKKKLALAMSNDLDTPAAIALLHEVVGKLGSSVGLHIIPLFDRALGLHLLRLADVMTHVPETIKKLSRHRENLRKEKKWGEADIVRKDIENQGFLIEDTQTGPLIYCSLGSLAAKDINKL